MHNPNVVFHFFFYLTVDKSSDVLRDQLKTAIKQNDKAGLQRAIEEAEAAGLPELGYDLRKARDALDKLGGGRGGKSYFILFYFCFYIQ